MGDQISDSVWVCVCQFIACMCMCCTCVWVCMWVRVSVSPLLWITSMYALHVCVLYVRPGVSGVSWCVSFIVWVWVCVCGLLQLSVCTTPGIAMVYYCVLMHGPYGKRVSVSVRYDCVCGQTLDLDCGSFWCSARFDRRCCTMHSMYLSSSGYLVLSGFSIWFLLSVHVCNLFSSCSVPLLYRKAL